MSYSSEYKALSTILKKIGYFLFNSEGKKEIQKFLPELQNIKEIFSAFGEECLFSIKIDNHYVVFDYVTLATFDDVQKRIDLHKIWYEDEKLIFVAISKDEIKRELDCPKNTTIVKKNVKQVHELFMKVFPYSLQLSMDFICANSDFNEAFYSKKNC